MDSSKAFATWHAVIPQDALTKPTGMSPQGMRALYTGAIRTIFKCGWNCLGIEHALESMKRVEYQALRKITGAYHGSSHERAPNITHTEPLEIKLDDMSISWEARSLRTGDPHIRGFLQEDRSWHDCRAPPLVPSRSSPIAEAFHKCSFERHERSYDKETTTVQRP